MEKKLKVIPSVVRRANSKLQNVQYPRQLLCLHISDKRCGYFRDLQETRLAVSKFKSR